MSAAREEMLQRIRAALQDVPSGEWVAQAPLERRYHRQDDAPHEELVGRFAERVAEYRATVHRVSTTQLSAAIAAALRRRGVQRLAVPPDLPREWLPPGLEILPDHDLSTEQLNAVDGVLTGCALGIALTGTIVLDSGPTQGRRALTLLPDYHLCVVRADQIVATVPEGIEQLHTAARAGSPITLISGPSATSDIELKRVEGVHGPRVLEVLLVDTIGDTNQH
ncbi:MAG: lactate utilization protein C [Chloroflexota bacterium]|nr:lactate utilization protein C [Chloroflexota bacterium]